MRWKYCSSPFIKKGSFDNVLCSFSTATRTNESIESFVVFRFFSHVVIVTTLQHWNQGTDSPWHLVLTSNCYERGNSFLQFSASNTNDLRFFLESLELHKRSSLLIHHSLNMLRSSFHHLLRKHNPRVALISKPLFRKQRVLSFHFASSEYAASFRDLPQPDIPKLRQSTIEYLDSFDETLWYKDPVRTGSIVYLFRATTINC